MSTAAWFTFFAGLVLLWLVVRYWGFPLLARALGNVTAARLSPFSAKGIEWRVRENAILPTLRVERVDWRWGGMRAEETGLVVLSMEGVSLRVKNKDVQGDAEELGSRDIKRKSTGRFAYLRSRFTSWILHIAIHHHPVLARIVSIRISDIRIIFDDLDSLECTVGDIQFGTSIQFEHRHDGEVAADIMSPPMSPVMGANGRTEGNMSPPASPSAFTSFINPFAANEPISGVPACDEGITARFSRLSQARRKATSGYAKVSSTAGQIWSRATGRAHGSVSFNLAISGIALILPHESAPAPSARPSIHDLRSEYAKGGSRRQSRSSGCFSIKSSPFAQSSATSSIPSFFRRNTKAASLTSVDVGYSTLACLKGVSKAKLGLGFGPKKGLLAEDTLNASVDIGKLDVIVGALDQVSELLKRKKAGRREAKAEAMIPAKATWSADSTPRVILRAFESATLSIASATVTHHIPKANVQPSSAASSTTDLTALSSGSDDVLTLSVEVDSLAIKLMAADASNNERAKNTFGTNRAVQSRIRGVGFGLEWNAIAMHCIAPGDAPSDKTQLFAIRQADIEGLNTWRPSGWTRDELLFADDPNMSLIIGRGAIASIDVAADLQLIGDLSASLQQYARARPDEVERPETERASKSPTLPPRVRLVLDVGPMMVALSEKIEETRMTLSIASDGCHLGCFTSFEDIIGRRRDFAGYKKAFSDEAALMDRRNAAGSDFDPAMAPAMLRPQYRRLKTVEHAALQDDLSIRMRIDANFEVEPVGIHLTLDKGNDATTETYELARIGKLHGKMTGSVSGTTEISDDGDESSSLDRTTASADIDIGVNDGIQLNLWKPAVISALIAIGEQRKLQPVPTKIGKTARPMLDKLPAGIAFRFSLGTVSALIGYTDPNPKCPEQLVRGLHIQTTCLAEYAYYTNRTQFTRDRSRLPNSAIRARLSLQEDVSTQAVAFFNELQAANGRAALAAITFSDTYVRPVYNGETFQVNDVSSRHSATRDAAEASGIDSRRYSAFDQLDRGDFANNAPHSNLDGHERAKAPLFRCPEIKVNIMAQRDRPESRTAIKLTAKLRRPSATCDMSRIYCAFVSSLVFRKLASAWKRPPAERPASEPLYDMSISVKIPTFSMHISFPLKEQIILDLGTIQITKPPSGGMSVSMERIFVYVPCPQEAGVWDELGRIRRLAVAMPRAEPDSPRVIDVNAEILRIRIPPTYVLAKLILNINVSIKSLKLLMRNFKTGEFNTRFEPSAEEPKRIPDIRLSVQRVGIEALDDPLETKLNLIFRAGIIEQQKRNALEDTWQAKASLMQMPEGDGSDDSLHAPAGDKKAAKLTKNATVSLLEARARLDWFNARAWTRRIRAARAERRRREAERSRYFHVPNADGHLQIKIAQREATPPLFRLSIDGLKLDLGALTWSRDEIVQYMSDCSTPFDKGVDFSLMLPVNLKWSMEWLRFTLRDYPLPLVCIQRSNNPDVPAWSFETPFIVAEDLHGPETWFNVPTEIIPPDLGSSGAAALHLEVQKTITPVKTYARPMVKIRSEKTAEFAWANSYQPTIQDMMKVMDTISLAPKDPSDKPGFWDKFRLNLHWRIQLDFTGPVHLHLKGSSDPYSFEGHGAGFALVWRHGTQFRIGYENPQSETIQAEGDELMVVIPDLTALHDGAAIGNEPTDDDKTAVNGSTHTKDEALVQRRYTKPCARFAGGIRIGFGFYFERTCRPWTCTKGCGQTEHLARRLCRIFDSKKHQDVIMRNPAAVEEAEQRLGHKSDSLEGFRSDFIHFSVSCVSLRAEREESKPASSRVAPTEADMSSLHFSPKAFAHFYAWWRLFNSATSLPIRQGKLFPNSPPPSKKFGRSLGTIKYRMHLADVFLSHVYAQVVPELWNLGKSQYLGVKAQFGRFKADLHQRRQERIVRHEKLGRTQVLPHKPFFAFDILLDDVVAKGVIAEFVEDRLDTAADTTTLNGDQVPLMAHVSDMPEERRAWYNFFDYIDADRKPFDHDPKVQIIDLADCPHFFFSKRDKARMATPRDDDDLDDQPFLDVETTRFDQEGTHICYLGQASGVGPTQIKIAERRQAQLLRELQQVQDNNSSTCNLTDKVLRTRIKSIRNYIQVLQDQEKRHMDDNTMKYVSVHRHDDLHDMLEEDEEFFRNQYHIHCPKIILNNTSRNLLYRYWFSSQDRKREEYATSYASLSAIRAGMAKRMHEGQLASKSPQTPTPRTPTAETAAFDLESEMERRLASDRHSRLFRLPADANASEGVRRLAELGIPDEAILLAMNNLTLFKPQIVLRSELDDDSIVLLAVEEISFRGIDVNDLASDHEDVQQILSRNFVFLKGVEAFYPTKENMRKARDEAGYPRGLDFLPLEIFLDVKNEATDYHRIVSKTDAGISVDKFNHLRLPRGIEWPRSMDDNGMPIEHLRLHQDLYNVILPRLTVSATSKHYSALYNIVTDLLIYKDPRQKDRSNRIQQFLLAFDRKDRDPAQLLFDLFHLQRKILDLYHLRAGYEANIDLLDADGQKELTHIRNDHLEDQEQLFTVFEAISVGTKREEARASLVQSSRLNVQAGGIAWQMLHDDLRPLVKLDIENTLLSFVNNKDGSVDQALRVGDVTGLNSNHDANFFEVLTRLDVAGAAKRVGPRKPFFSAVWSTTGPVGGISIVRNTRYFLHPLRIALEEKVAQEIVNYVFAGRAKRKAEAKASRRVSKPKDKDTDGSPRIEVNGKREAPPSATRADFAPLQRSKSSASVASVRLAVQADNKTNGDEKFTMVPSQDAQIMRQRANTTKTFVLIEVPPTTISLSYKSDENRKRGTWSLPDCADLRVKTPFLQYRNKVWGYEDVFEAFKKDFKSHAWSQSGDLVSQLLKKTSLFRSKKALGKLANLHTDFPARLTSAPSRLRYNVNSDSPLSVQPDDDGDNLNPLMRALSTRRGSRGAEPTSPIARRLSIGRDPSLSPRDQEGDHDGANEEEEQVDREDDDGRVGRVKGFLGRLGRRRDNREDPSTEDLSLSPATTPSERRPRYPGSPPPAHTHTAGMIAGLG